MYNTIQTLNTKKTQSHTIDYFAPF